MRANEEFLKNIQFTCARHEKHPRLRKTGWGTDMTFRCKDYFQTYRESGSPPCNNYLLESDMRVAAYQLFQKLQEMEFNHTNVNLTNYSFEYRGIKYKVLKHNISSNWMLVSFENTAENAKNNIKGD